MLQELLTYAPLLAGLLCASVFAGLLAGFLGVGGGIVLVPAMFWMFQFVDFDPDIAMHMAVATSLGTIIFTAISSARAHHKRGSVDVTLLKRWGPFVAIGALSGGLMARYFDGDALTALFGCIGALVALNFLRKSPLVVAAALPSSTAKNVGIAGSIGFVSALMGIGGGTLGVPTLSAFSFPIKRAVGTSAAFGLIIAAPAALGFIVSGLGIDGRPPLSLGYVSLPAVLAIIPITTRLAPIGAALAHKVEARWVQLGFAVFLGITAVRMMASVFA